MIDLVQNSINANITKTSIKKDSKTLYVRDGRIDIFESYMQMHYIIQAKFRTDEESYISPQDVRKFAAVLMEQPENTVEFFVSNCRFLTRSQNIANNSRVKLILCNDNSLIKKIKEEQRLYQVSDIISVEDITTEENMNTEIFGVKFNRKIRIRRIKKIRNSVSPY